MTCDSCHLSDQPNLQPTPNLLQTTMSVSLKAPPGSTKLVFDGVEIPSRNRKDSKLTGEEEIKNKMKALKNVGFLSKLIMAADVSLSSPKL